MTAFILAGAWKAILAVAAVLGLWFTADRRGANREKRKQEDADNETALDINSRVDDIKQLRDDELEYRDDPNDLPKG